MSMLKMQKINIFALKKHRKDILETLQRKGVIEITDNILEDNVFYKEKTSSQQVSFLKSSQVAANACEILCKYCENKGSILSAFEGRKPISKENYYTFVDNSTEIMRVAYELISYQKEINEMINSSKNSYTTNVVTVPGNLEQLLGIATTSNGNQKPQNILFKYDNDEIPKENIDKFINIINASLSGTEL